MKVDSGISLLHLAYLFNYQEGFMHLVDFVPFL